MNQPAESLSEFIPADNLQGHLKITRPVLRAWIARGLPYVRVGLRLYFREKSVAAWLSQQERTRDALAVHPEAGKEDNASAPQLHQRAPQSTTPKRESRVPAKR